MSARRDASESLTRGRADDVPSNIQSHRDSLYPLPVTTACNGGGKAIIRLRELRFVEGARGRSGRVQGALRRAQKTFFLPIWTGW